MQALKERLYFVVAWYFRLFAALKLRRWRPTVIVVTGSSGKTTLLHMLEAQLGQRAHYSHHANSAFGVPFDILGMEGVTGSRLKWLGLFLAAPLKALSRPYPEKLYVAEVDAERPGEAPFLANLLRPHITLWVSSARTHSRFFDAAVRAGRFANVEEAVAHEYAQVGKASRQLVLFDGDHPLMAAALGQTAAQQVPVGTGDLNLYELGRQGTRFTLANGHAYQLPQPQPREVFHQVAFVDRLLAELHLEPDFSFESLELPPGRSNVLDGQKGVTIVDSSYNANLSSMAAVLGMFKEFPGEHKWLVLGDMLEQGEGEADEHRKLAALAAESKPEHVVLLGPRVIKDTKPELEKLLPGTPVVGYENPKEVLDYLKANLKGGETVLFKGARFLEGVIEHLLANPEDAAKLCRREPVWAKRRAQWGL